MRELTAERAARLLVDHHGLRRVVPESGAAGARRVLAERRCVQLDPLDVIGTNADLVMQARVDGLVRGAVYDALLPGHAFEHFAKERCLLPASAFPAYREQAAETPWWRLGERQKRLPAGVVDRVLEELVGLGRAATADELCDHGAVEALDWSGWKGTAKATTMALEVLWTQCRVVVAGRSGRGKVYDVPERALGTARAPAPASFGRWALGERVEAAGLLARAGGAHWSMLREVREGPLPDAMVSEGVIEELTVAGSRRVYLAPAGVLDRDHPEDDGRMRILGPLDPVLWDRQLVRHAFGFDYVWEVYKPAAKRRWGWYVCPLLHRGRLVGRFEPAVEAGELRVKNLWIEDGAAFDHAAFEVALGRQQALLG